MPTQQRQKRKGLVRIMRCMVRAGTRTATAVAVVLGIFLLVVGCGGGSEGQSQSKGQSHTSVPSSIPDGAKLRGALPWTAKPESDTDSLVAKVDFLIDDKQLLATWLLGPGQHSLAVRADTIDGKSAQSAAQVTVSDPPTIPDV